jgi:hypothetical protein
MNRYRNAFAGGLLGLATLAHVVLFSALPLSWRTVAALCIAGFIPGVLLVEWLLGQYDDTLAVDEHLLYAIGAGYAILVCGTLFASYLPGGLSQAEMLAIFDGLIVVFFGLWWRKPHPPRPEARPEGNRPRARAPDWKSSVKRGGEFRWLVAGWVSLLLVGGFFRLTDLSYSEFQSDEASPALRAVAVVQGNEDVLFLHKKGPTEILIPAALLALTGQLSEQSGRLPFALANFVCLPAVFVLGWRLLNPLAGWIAAMLLALDGYYIGYAHMLQYQSILFLMTPLVVLLLYGLPHPPLSSPEQKSRSGEEENLIRLTASSPYWGGLGKGLLLASLFVTTGLLSHYDGILVFLPGLYLLWMLVRRGVPVRQLGRALIIPIGVSSVPLASFYLPFVLHPHFQETYDYYATHVIGTSQWLYNHLVEFADRATLFDTVYAFWLTSGVTILALALLYWRGRSGWQGRALGTVVVLISLSAIFAPNGLVISSVDLMPFLVGLLLLGALLIPKLSFADRLLWLWFSLPLCQALFLTKEPSAHFHVFIVPWLLITGQTLAWLWQQLRTVVGERAALIMGVGVAAICIVLFGSYEYWFYLDHAEVARHWQEIERPRWWPLHESVAGQPLFGLPHYSGWKVIGLLYQEGKLRGSYKTNIRAWASDWYTRGAEYCENKPPYIFLETGGRPEEQVQLRAKMKDQYQLFGTVYAYGQPRLEIYQWGAVTTPQRFDAENYAARFDAQLSGPNFRLGPPAVEPVMTPVHYRLGEQIELVGYRLEQTQARPGGTLLLTLHWRVNDRVTTNYTLFNQIVGPHDKMLGQLDTEPSCTGGPTAKWKPGGVMTGYYQIPIFADAKPGVYPLQVGLYQPDNGERLPVYDANGNPIGDQIPLHQIRFEP